MVELVQDDDEGTIGTSSSTPGLKNRASKSRKGSDDDDALEWVEENLSDVDEMGPLYGSFFFTNPLMTHPL